MRRGELMALKAIEMAMDNGHGYSQLPPSGRWGPDYDCSSFAYKVADDAGFDVGTGNDGGTARWTGTMAKDFTDAGFQLLPFANVGIDGLEIGDILLNLAVHAEVYVGDGEVAGAQASEDGGFSGKAGDQTGSEITIQPVYTHSHGWNYVLRPPSEDDGAEKEPRERGFKMAMPYSNMPPMGGWQGRNMGYQQGNQQYNGFSQGYQQGYPQQQMNRGQAQGTMPNFGQQGYQQGYSQSSQMPYYGQQGYMQGGQAGLVTVNGIEEAANYPAQPGCIVPLFDVHKDVLYFKQVSPDGIPSVTAYEFHEIQEPMPQHGGNTIGRLMGNQSGQQVSREEFEQLKEAMMNGQSYMGQQSADVQPEQQANNAPQQNQQRGSRS